MGLWVLEGIFWSRQCVSRNPTQMWKYMWKILPLSIGFFNKCYIGMHLFMQCTKAPTATHTSPFIWCIEILQCIPSCGNPGPCQRVWAVCLCLRVLDFLQHHYEGGTITSSVASRDSYFPLLWQSKLTGMDWECLLFPIWIQKNSHFKTENGTHSPPWRMHLHKVRRNESSHAASHKRDKWILVNEIQTTSNTKSFLLHSKKRREFSVETITETLHFRFTFVVINFRKGGKEGEPVSSANTPLAPQMHFMHHSLRAELMRWQL